MANALDPYSYCPCGSGKKLKFCCQDLAAEMQRIHEMLEGGQRAAALEYIESLEKKFPDRADLVTTKALLQSILGSDEKAAATMAFAINTQVRLGVARNVVRISPVRYSPVTVIDARIMSTGTPNTATERQSE